MTKRNQVTKDFVIRWNKKKSKWGTYRTKNGRVVRMGKLYVYRADQPLFWNMDGVYSDGVDHVMHLTRSG